MNTAFKNVSVRIFLCGIALVLAFFLLYAFVPLLSGGETIKPASKVFDRYGTVLYEIRNNGPTKLIVEDDVREVLAGRENPQIPSYLIEALVASEDRHFFRHIGIDFGAIFSGGLSGRGASTLTSQGIKLRYFPSEPRHLFQKGREFLLAVATTTWTSKEATLADYLNRASFGRGYTGIWAASEGYFGKAPSMLSLGESALLVGLLPAPEAYSPVVSMSKAKERQQLVLRRMVSEGYISEEEALEAHQIPVTITSQQKSILAPHAVQEAIRQAKQIYPDLEKGGYTIRTTIDLEWHRELSRVIQEDIKGLADKNVSNAAAVVIDPESGEIRVMIGSKDYFSSSIDGAFNVATAKRQPGSSLKPFTYLAAFLQGMSPGSIVYDIESSFETASGDPYIPRNYDLKFHGPVSMRIALGSSLNIPAVKTLEIVGFDAWYALLQEFGIHFDKDPEFYGLGITLGGGEVTLTELTHAYSLLANNGKETQAHLISSIDNERGESVYRHAPTGSGSRLPSDQERLEAGIVMVNDILRDNSAREISFGLTSRLRITDAVAVKTGTTKDYRDNWAFGYTPKIAAGVWVGNNNNSPMEGVTGITGAIPILHDFLRLRTQETLPENISWPNSPLLQKVRICTFSNMLATTLCPYTREELYLSGTAPTQEDTWFREIEVDKTTGLAVDETCTSSTEKKIVVEVPLILTRWAQSVLLEQPPNRTCSGKVVKNTTEYQITHPKPDDSFLLRSNIPQEAQRIPVHIDGSGYIQTTIFLDGNPISIEGDLPITRFIDASPGEHMLTGSNSAIKFSVKQQ